MRNQYAVQAAQMQTFCLTKNYLLYLSIVDSTLHSLNALQFNKLVFLTHLLLQNDSIVMIHPHAFVGLKSIRYINLKMNPITQLSVTKLTTLESLQYLDVSNTKILKIEMHEKIKLHQLLARHTLLTKISGVSPESKDRN